MLRTNWIFEFTAEVLAKAACDKKAHHKSRLEFWREAKAKVMIEVRECGVEVSESAAGDNYTSNMMRGPQVLVRNDLQGKLTECHQKIKEHDAKVGEYDGWLQVLKSDPGKRLQLNADDYLYFFGIFK